MSTSNSPICYGVGCHQVHADEDNLQLSLFLIVRILIVKLVRILLVVFLEILLANKLRKRASLSLMPWFLVKFSDLDYKIKSLLLGSLQKSLNSLSL